MNAIVTGASRGIGKQIAIQLAKLGYNLVIHYNQSTQSSIDLAQYLKKEYKIKTYVFQANLMDYEQIINLYNFSLNKLNTIDVLINNAGICINKEFCDRNLEDFYKTFQVNLFSVYQLSKLVGSHMYNNKSGKIVNISSDNSINNFDPTTIDYDASKSALNSLTKNLAIQFAPYVNVNAIAPGWILTDMDKDILTPDIVELESQKILKKRMGKVEDVANLVEFLVSSKSDYIDGEIIVINGGMF